MIAQNILFHFEKRGRQEIIVIIGVLIRKYARRFTIFIQKKCFCKYNYIKTPLSNKTIALIASVR